MITRLFPLILATLFFVSTATAQEPSNWKRHKKVAEKLFESKQYIDAAGHYLDAWKLHTKDNELIYKAGECFYLIKDYKKTIQAFQHVKTDNKQFPLVGLKYARALKQDGQYKAAKEAFLYFINAYQADDKVTVSTIVANEIEGCKQGIALAKNPSASKIVVKHLTENINSPAVEFAPIPYTDDLLYYSSTMKGKKAHLFRSQRKNGKWNRAVIAEGLPNFPDKHFANGSFAPDAKRFYFTLCDGRDELNSKCEIYVLKRNGAKWSAPIRLRDYINIDNATTTTQPWVIHQNGLEILYFASNRSGGFGEMDIWYSTRNIASDDIDFTYPVNAGAKINTIGHEITPFYDLKKETLYYSSNGKITLGGWDVFKAKGALDKWEQAENLGAPINSNADEFYFVLKPSGKSGFLVSNRLFGAEKITTLHDDIFEFGANEKTSSLNAIGQVLDGETMSPINDVRISLYEVAGSRAKLLSSKKIAQSNYRFQILPGKKLRLVAEKTGYLKNVYDFESYSAENTFDYTHIFSLHKQTPANSIVAAPREKTNQNIPAYTASTAKFNESVSSAKPQQNTSSPSRRFRPSSSASAGVSVGVRSTSPVTGTIYKVQVVAVNYHDINHPRYRKVKNIGRIETEELAGRGITRVLITDLANKQAAQKIKKQVVQYGFVDAFVVKYQNGKRIGRL